MTLEEKVQVFYTALVDCFRDKGDRKLDAFQKIELDTAETNDITAMFIAVYLFYMDYSGDADYDLIKFSYILNKLAIGVVFGEEGARDDDRS